MHTEQSRNKYYGPYLGFVRDRNDPAKLGRVRVHMPVLLGADNVPDHWTDWAYPMSSGLNVPKQDAAVIVFFEQGFITHPMYTYGWLLGTNQADSAAPNVGKGVPDPTCLQQEQISAGGTGVQPIQVTFPADSAADPKTAPVYPNNRVFEIGGFKFEIDDSPNNARARLLHPSGLTLLIDVDGSLHFRNGGAMYFHPGGDFVVGLKAGSTFKVVYPGGTSMICGGMGFHIKGHSASILGRTVKRKETDIE